ncbi:MAG: Uma2 family endonuclease [Actinobacteria bacterium]|nr:MAG: Uma2 family endonuclease [Actinomycetota bacterium]
MVAATVETGIEESGDSIWRPPYTVDTLFELPETNLRFEVLEGKLIVSPPPTTAHNSIYAELFRVFLSTLPKEVRILTNNAIRLPNGDGPIPDLLVCTAARPAAYPKGLPAAHVHTVVEVVSPSNARTDRVTKTRVYAEAGIPCYWRIEQRPWKEHLGPRMAPDDRSGRHGNRTSRRRRYRRHHRQRDARSCPAGRLIRPRRRSGRSSGGGGTCR